jgi:hypothetical protein
MAITRTVAQVIDLVQGHLPADSGRALQVFNEAHLYILTQVRLVPDVSSTIALISGQQEYSLPDGVAKIWDASYYSSASSYTPLQPTNVDSLFEDLGANWQLSSAGQPWGFYERGGMLGLVPAPNAATAAGFPNVTLFYTPATNLGLQDTLPTNVSSVYPWVYRMCEKLALSFSKEVSFADRVTMQVKFHQLFEQEMHYLREYMYGRVARDRVRAAARIPRIRRP